VRVDAVAADADDLGVAFLELLVALAERREFRRSHEGEIEGVEVEDDPLPLEVLERDRFDLPFDISLPPEGGSRQSRTHHASAPFVNNPDKDRGRRPKTLGPGSRGSATAE